MTDEEDLGSTRLRRDGVGPVALLLPVAFALLTFAFLRERMMQEREGPRAEPPSTTRFLEVAGWAGELETVIPSTGEPGRALPDEVSQGALGEAPFEPLRATSAEGTVSVGGEARGGARLFASLRPLQSLPERQAFDAAVLRKRFGFEDGEPWRLELRYREPREEAKLQPLAVRNFSEITIFDELGPALVPLASDPALDAAEGVVQNVVADPLRVLCSTPDIPLRPGYELTLFLWGRRPEGSLRLEGLAGGPFDATPTMNLIPRSLPAQPLHESLAKLERVTKR